jgi:hypothetical protein
MPSVKKTHGKIAECNIMDNISANLAQVHCRVQALPAIIDN